MSRSVASPSAAKSLQGNVPLNGSSLERLVHDPLTAATEDVVELIATNPHRRR